MLADQSLEQFRDREGDLLPCTWPGMYTIIFLTRDGETLCHTCANEIDKEKRALIDKRISRRNELGQWLSNQEIEQLGYSIQMRNDIGPHSAYVYEEGDAIACDNCGNWIIEPEEAA